jgi:hypothetical protein
MGMETEEKEERRERIEIKTVEDLWKILGPPASFARFSLDAAQGRLVTVIHFIETVVDKGLKGDQTLFDYIKDCGKDMLLDAYRVLADLVHIRETLEDDFMDMGADLAEALGIKEKEKEKDSA